MHDINVSLINKTKTYNSFTVRNSHLTDWVTMVTHFKVKQKYFHSIDFSHKKSDYF